MRGYWHSFTRQQFRNNYFIQPLILLLVNNSKQNQDIEETKNDSNIIAFCGSYICLCSKLQLYVPQFPFLQREQKTFQGALEQDQESRNWKEKVQRFTSQSAWVQRASNVEIQKDWWKPGEFYTPTHHSINRTARVYWCNHLGATRRTPAWLSNRVIGKALSCTWES